jgi:radical SAM superfamily enzyme YgiQ (UPF0313 family)
MRVALVWVNTQGPSGLNHGVLILARELREAGHPVSLHCLGGAQGQHTDAKGLVKELAAARPGLVGLSFASPEAGVARGLVRSMRAAMPGSLIFCGGIHATLDPEGVFAWPELDGVGMGELDGGHFARLVTRLARGERPSQVPGFWLRWDGKEHRNPMASLPDIEDQPLPLYEGLDLDGLVRAKRGFGEVLASRGCPFRCRFCQNAAVVERYRESLGTSPSSWPYVRRRGLDGLMAELLELKARAPSLQAIMFADDRLAGDPAWLEVFADRYRKEIGLPFIANATADQIDPRTAALLRHAGCNMVKIGVECAPGELRRRVLGRPESEAVLRAAFERLRAAGINAMAYLMIGIPGEDPDALAETFRFCASLRPDAVRLAMFCPYPGTAVHADLVARGVLGPEDRSRGFGDPSALPWTDEMRRLLALAQRLLPWLLNQHLVSVGAASRALVARWWAGGKAPCCLDELASEEASLWRELERAGLPHYACPFPERPDYVFLMAEREQPLINVGGSKVTTGP